MENHKAKTTFENIVIFLNFNREKRNAAINCFLSRGRLVLCLKKNLFRMFIFLRFHGFVTTILEKYLILKYMSNVNVFL